MLDLFRQRGLSSIVYGVVIAATILVFVIQFRPNAGQKTAQLNEACVARVRGWCVDPKDHRAAYQLLTPRDSQGNRLVQRARQMGLSRIALDGLIERELLVAEADRLGLRVTDDEITDQIYDGWIRVSVPSDDQKAAQLRMGLPNGMLYAGFRDPKTKQFDVKIYERQLRGLVGRSPNEFREEQGREILAAKVRDLVVAAVRVSEPEALDLYVSEKSNATVSHVNVKQAWVQRWGVKATPADVDEWMKDKANADVVDAMVKTREPDDAPKEGHIRHVLVKTPPNASEEDIQKAALKLGAAKARVAAGASFAEVARELSDDKGSALRGGDVGDKTDGFVAPFKEAADKLKAGEITSTAIQTQFGLHWIMKDDVSKAEAIKAAARKDIAREMFIKAQGIDKTKGLAAKLLDDMKAGKKPEDAIAAVAASFPKPAAAAPAMAITREKKEIADAGADATVSSAPIKSTTPAPNSDVKPLSPDTDSDRPEVVTSPPFNRGGDPVSGLSADGQKQVIDFAFSPSAKDGDWVKDALRSDDGFILVTLKDHKTVTKEEFDKDKEVFLQTLLAGKRAEALAVYVKRLRDAAKDSIKIDETYLIDAKADAGATPFDEDEEGP
jgi:peptidyl-prolyl cis-trans isomerase D